MTSSFFAAVGFFYLFVGWLFYRLWCAGRARVVGGLAVGIVFLSLGFFLFATADPEAIGLRAAGLFLGLPVLCCAGLGVIFARNTLRKAQG
jgi:hypothetical protein